MAFTIETKLTLICRFTVELVRNFSPVIFSFWVSASKRGFTLVTFKLMAFM